MEDVNSRVKIIQKYLFKMLSFFDDFCKKNNLIYFLDGGTLLGSIRHNGFIPWDDDADIVMPRKDYNRLIKLFKKNQFDNYCFECIENSKNYEYNFGKLKFKKVIAVEKGLENTKSLKFLWIDIFPLDKTNCLLYKAQCKFSQFWQYVRWNKIKVNFGKNKNFLVAFFAKITPISLVNFNCNVWLKLCNPFPNKKVCKICHPGKGKEPHLSSFYSKQEFHSFVFEDTSLMLPIPNKPREWLNFRYGNWEEIPREEDRVGGHGLSSFEVQ